MRSEHTRWWSDRTRKESVPDRSRGVYRRYEDGEQCSGYRTDGKGGDTVHGGACFYLLFLLLLSHRFRHKLRHSVFSFTKRVF
jgi:hypothetical protein